MPDETLLQNTVARRSLQLNWKRAKTNASRVLLLGVNIMGVFSLDRDPSLFSWWQKSLNLANANKL